MTAGTVAFVNSDCRLAIRFNFKDGWEGEIHDVLDLTTMAGAAVRPTNCRRSGGRFFSLIWLRGHLVCMNTFVRVEEDVC